MALFRFVLERVRGAVLAVAVIVLVKSAAVLAGGLAAPEPDTRAAPAAIVHLP
ncbi:MAG: hypothetical protein AB7L65_07790 [Hyphomonadaceae bacterium]